MRCCLPKALRWKVLAIRCLKQYDQIEVREYEAHLLATVTVASDFERAGNEAFRDLFEYIDGNNAAQQNIAMTAPVLQEPAGAQW